MFIFVLLFNLISCLQTDTLQNMLRRANAIHLSGDKIEKPFALTGAACFMDNCTETWKNIPGYDGKYLVSNFGNVLSRESYVVFNGKKVRKKPRILKSASNGRGYQYVTISIDKKRHNYYIHRLVAEAFLETPSVKSEVNHKNGIKHDNNLTNLEWVSRKENLNHAIKNNLLPRRGDKHNAIQIINVATGEIFSCIKDAADRYNIIYGTLKDGLKRKSIFRNLSRITKPNTYTIMDPKEKGEEVEQPTPPAKETQGSEEQQQPATDQPPADDEQKEVAKGGE